MMSQLHADGVAVGTPFKLEADCFVQRTHALREQLCVQNLLRERVPKGQLAGRAPPLVDEMKRLRALQRKQHVLSRPVEERHQTFDLEAFAKDSGQRQYLPLRVREQRGPR
jgi:hypothetical protein